MSAGRPVRKRDRGFANDLAALGRLRTALRITDKLEPIERDLAIRDLDSLIERLSKLHLAIQMSAA
jgi:hypothetical protein